MLDVSGCYFQSKMFSGDYDALALFANATEPTTVLLQKTTFQSNTVAEKGAHPLVGAAQCGVPVPAPCTQAPAWERPCAWTTLWTAAS